MSILNTKRIFDNLNLLDPKEVQKFDENDTFRTIIHPQDVIDWGLRDSGPMGEYYMAEHMQTLLNEHIALRAKYVEEVRKFNTLQDAADNLIVRCSKL